MTAKVKATSPPSTAIVVTVEARTSRSTSPLLTASLTGLLDELVPDAMDRHDELRLLRPRLQLLPEMGHVGVDGSRGRIVLVAPHIVEQTLPRQRLAGMGDEIRE